MNEGLLQTKLQIPILRSPFLVQRPHLLERLNAGMMGAVTLVAAPAGFGKTTLVAEWVRQEGLPVAWLSLDEQDNDLARFLAYFIGALRGVLDDVGEAPLAMLQGLQTPPLDAIIAPLINDIGRAPEPFFLVLDDYHLIKEPQIHEALIFLLGHLPPSLHLVLSSRADPPLPLARLRGQGVLNEVRQADLGFTLEETAEFLNQVLGLGLAATDLERLNRRTEGWPAGLQMAAISLRQQEDPAAFVRAFSGSNRYVLDYLMEEVLAQQPPAIQQFLLLTSVLERLTTALCARLLEVVAGEGASRSAPTRDPINALMGSDEGAPSILEYLDGANLFVVPLDDERHWYRYHRLFADLLRQRLQQTAPQLAPLLHARARDWYWEKGWHAEAARHALQAGDDDQAARLIEAAAEPALQKSQLHTVLRWVEALPGEQVSKRPRLALYYAWALLLSGAPVEAIEPYLPQSAGPGDGTAEDGEPLPAAVLLQAFLATLRGQMGQARELAQQALHGIDAEDRFWRSMAVWVLSISYHDPTAGSTVEDMTWEETARFARESGNLLVMVSAMCEQGHANKRRGRLQYARDCFEQALALATPGGEQPLPIAGEALMGMAEIDLEWNDLQGAGALLEEGLARTRQWREVAMLPGYFQLARLRQVRGDETGAGAALREAARLATLFDATELDDAVVAAYQAHLWIMQGRLELAEVWAVRQGLILSESEAARAQEFGEQYEGLRPFEELILSRLLLANGEFDAAVSLHERLLATFKTWRHTRLIIETLLLQTQAYAALGEMDQALAALHEALILGEPGGYVLSFVQEGPPIVDLLVQLRVRGHPSDAYVARLIEAGGGRESAVGREAPQPLVEPLTARELEILGLIAEGLSNREIGQRLFLSLTTVKWHSSNIYGKLGVKNRTTAVAKARELDILQG